MNNYIISTFLFFTSCNLFSQSAIEKYFWNLNVDKSYELSNISAQFNNENGDLCIVEFNEKGKIVVIKSVISLVNYSKKNSSKFNSFINNSSNPDYQQLINTTKKIKEEISKTGWYSRNTSNDSYDYISIDFSYFKRLSTQRSGGYLYVIVSEINDWAYISEPIELKFANMSELLEYNDELYNNRIKLEEAKFDYESSQRMIADSIARIKSIKLQEYNDSIASEQRAEKLENEKKLQERNSDRLKITSVVTEKLLYDIFIAQSKYEKDPFSTYEENVNNSKKLIANYINKKYKLIIDENQIREFYNAEYEEFEDREHYLIKFENSLYRISLCYGSINDDDIIIPIPKEKARNLKRIEVIMSTTGIIHGGYLIGDKEFREYEKNKNDKQYYGNQCLNFIIDSYILIYKDDTVEIIEK